MQRKSEYTSALLLIVLGVACLLFTGHVHALLPFVLGWMTSAIGALAIGKAIQTQEYRTGKGGTLAMGIILLLLGLIIVLHRENSDAFIGVVWGLLGLIKGGRSLEGAICALFAGGRFMLSLLTAGTELLLGFMLIFDPFGKVETHIAILGVELLVFAAQIIYTARKRGGDESAIL